MFCFNFIDSVPEFNCPLCMLVSNISNFVLYWYFGYFYNRYAFLKIKMMLKKTQQDVIRKFMGANKTKLIKLSGYEYIQRKQFLCENIAYLNLLFQCKC